MEPPKRNVLQRLVHAVGLYCFYLKLYFRTLVEYRADTWVTLFTGFVTQAGALAFVGLVFQRLPGLAGWGFHELVFLFGFSVTGRALCEVFLNVPFNMTWYIRTGTLDVFLIRPAGPLFQAIGISQEINGSGPALTGLAVLAYAGMHLTLRWTVGKTLYLGMALLCSMLIYFSTLMAVAILTFWVLEVRNAVYPVAWFYDFTRYPLTIFPPVVRGMLVFVIPYAFGSFYPAVYILRPASLPWAAWGVPVFTAAFLSVVYAFWRYGLRHYSSAT